jgi:hypothetical protein
VYHLETQSRAEMSRRMINLVVFAQTTRCGHGSAFSMRVKCHPSLTALL